MFKHALGARARDTVTEFEGTIVGRVEYISGCRQYCLQPKVGADGKIPDSVYFDEDRLAVSHPAEVIPLPRENDGGPQRDVPSH